MKISNYDEYNYNYKDYWNNREYEDRAEKIYLEKCFSRLKGKWFIDVGGSFGRNTSLYSGKFERSVIVDYSIKTLIDNSQEILKRYPNTYLIAANAYKLPFKAQTFDGGLMVRVLHHLDDPEVYFKEISRIINGDGIYIQEFANMHHIKAVIRNILKLNFKFLNQDRYQQPNKGNFEGTEGQSTTFLNFSERYIRKLLSTNNLKPQSSQGVSFLRVPILKRLFKTSFLVTLESILQRLFRGNHFTPSTFVVSRKVGERYEEVSNNISDIICCPDCKKDLVINRDTALCKGCERKYTKVDNIWDFRV